MGLQGLDFQTIDVKFTQGLDTTTQRKLVLPGKWDRLENVALSADGTPMRRDGIESLVAGTGNGLATLGNEMLVVNGSTVSTISTAISQIEPRTGSLGNVFINKAEVRRGQGMQSGFDCAVGGGFICHVWIDSTFSAGTATQTGIYCTIVDEATGAQVISNLQLNSSARAISPRVVFSPAASVSSTAAFMIFYIDGATTELLCTVIETLTMAVGTEVALVTNASLAFANFDAIPMYIHGVNKGAMVAYWWNTAGSSLRTIHVSHAAGVPSIDAGPISLFTRAQLSDAAPGGVCCVAFSAIRAGVFASAPAGSLGGVAGAVIDDTWAITTAATQLDATAAVDTSHITGALQGASVFLFVDQQGNFGTAGLYPIRAIGVSSTLVINSGPVTCGNSAAFTAGLGGQAIGPSGPWICGKAFTSGSSVYLPCCVMERYTLLTADENTLNEQNAFFLLEATSSKHDALVPVGRALYGSFGFPCPTGALGSNPDPSVSSPCSVAALSAGGFALCCAETTLLSIANGLNISATGICRLTLTPNTTTSPSRVEFGQSAFFAGGQLCAYDGAMVVEHGFPLFPEGLSVLVNVGVGDITAGVHQLVGIYEWTDNQGRRHQSSPSQPVTWTSLGSDTAIVSVPTLLLSQKTNVQIVLFMTQAGGTSYTRCISISAPVPNITSAQVVSITLGGAAHPASDAEIAGNELLYNQPDQSGSALPNVSPGPCSALGLHQNRLWVDVTDNPNAYRFSQELVAGVGLQFSDELGGLLPEAGGGLVGWAELDEKMILFGRRRLFVVFGSGPTTSGGFSNYSTPQAIATDVGCSERRSILQMPNGIIFKSQKGWYLLGRDLSVRWIGEGVEAYDDNDVTGAALLEDRRECRFSSSSGTQLIFSYLSEVWSTTVYRYDPGTGALPYPVLDALWWPSASEYVTVSALGVSRDTPGVYLDHPFPADPLPIITTMRTSWLHVGVLSGYQRVRRLFLTGTASTAPTSSLQIFVDYDDAYGGLAPGAYSFTVATGTAFAGLSIGQSADLRTKLQRQKCKSVAFTFIDTPLIDNPAGVNFQALALEVGLKRGVRRLPAAQSVG